ncbi:carboxymuconolactone decarboxylase family protein [Streptomyces mobaraensis NBRC 13819 = DSM 40847]|uniref:Carboxymuconolactone decarboxylase family protein n=2 Tax=Streptomyces mobaraensis TaxID=35621 RepID=A0A5N5W4D0_STRMB|nr:carboxymuconolactone decarboxylase family protein [Streptomyces mobaraensis]EMF00173.1 carboxymuconolactone decarboxylase [Streptomyces mobaraensis NBRC 13819 = DSM 40847]KAB7839916.1 carboxymuconolactone decarboxylase family protein [Streptomyces mobaraensis]QTT72480.1 carboxymuconolactone decarboxylase family protein [Streptomyces mobaraensis NBRC 13819 = DSM 40847]
MTEDTGTEPRGAAFDRAAGYRLLEELQDERTREATLPALEAVAPGFADWIVTSLFGGTYQRGGLSLRDRQIANLAALAAMGGVEPQLAGHVTTGLRVGLTAEEITEVFVHLAPYIGVPRAVAGLRVAAPALAAAGTASHTTGGAA